MQPRELQGENPQSKPSRAGLSRSAVILPALSARVQGDSGAMASAHLNSSGRRMRRDSLQIGPRNGFFEPSNDIGCREVIDA
jgi:hypothetical protein